MGRRGLVRLHKSSSLSTDWFSRPKNLGEKADQLIESRVKNIIGNVRKDGDSAVIKFTRIFDEVDFEAYSLRATPEDVDEAYTEVNERQVAALTFLKERVEEVEKRLLGRMQVAFEENGIRIHNSTYPIESVGCYVPGREVAYPSTLVMTSVPAKVAGVPRTVVCSPPSKTGSVNPLVLVAADICQVDEIFKVGGVQAIASLAYGTESIKPVSKIVGPGNKYVTKAKLLVSKDVAIDMLAGPSEVLILADETADPRFVALDMISQAEHGVDSVAGLLTTSKRVAVAVADALRGIMRQVKRRAVVRDALSENGFIIVCEKMMEMIELANMYAPEHIELMVQNPSALVDKLKSAGLILLGPHSPVALSDYAIGSNHVLPTSGFGHVFSGLSVLDFIRRVQIVECSKQGLRRLESNVRVLAEAEGLPNHYAAVEGRFKNANPS